jgi:predicted transposase YbfD/YdcC
VEGGGEYVLVVKDNQPTLHAAISDYFHELHETDFADCEVRQLTRLDNGHGRQERRTYYVTPLPESLRSFAEDWKKLTSVGQVINITFRDGREVADIRYFILSLQPRVKRFASAVRGHWGIENSLHSRARHDIPRRRKPHPKGPWPGELRYHPTRCAVAHQTGQIKGKCEKETQTRRMEQRGTLNLCSERMLRCGCPE